ncbi:MarR family winged helix-turn-helix transcriptional regulator [Campylobacter sp.]|uniref:MarR family winged helix-turn-helix transcriptional regulator n=1 Tax=Campylobacter sp. TaxID=205 RepID=UPI00270E5123|nr:MarR family transcriptional regulator [Campylobacter sp.]
MKNQNLNKNAVSLASKLRERANKFIVSKLKEHGIVDISPSHGDIIAILFDEKEHDMGEIAKRISKTKPTVTVLVEKLETCGYVSRFKDDEDGRIVLVKLTEKSIRLKSVFESIAEELNSIVYNGFSEMEAEILERLLQKAVLNFQEV